MKHPQHAFWLLWFVQSKSRCDPATSTPTSEALPCITLSAFSHLSEGCYGFQRFREEAKAKGIALFNFALFVLHHHRQKGIDLGTFVRILNPTGEPHVVINEWHSSAVPKGEAHRWCVELTREGCTAMRWVENEIKRLYHLDDEEYRRNFGCSSSDSRPSPAPAAASLPAAPPSPPGTPVGTCEVVLRPAASALPPTADALSQDCPRAVCAASTRCPTPPLPSVPHGASHHGPATSACVGRSPSATDEAPRRNGGSFDALATPQPPPLADLARRPPHEGGPQTTRMARKRESPTGHSEAHEPDDHVPLQHPHATEEAGRANGSGTIPSCDAPLSGTRAAAESEQGDDILQGILSDAPGEEDFSDEEEDEDVDKEAVEEAEQEKERGRGGEGDENEDDGDYDDERPPQRREGGRYSLSPPASPVVSSSSAAGPANTITPMTRRARNDGTERSSPAAARHHDQGPRHWDHRPACKRPRTSFGYNHNSSSSSARAGRGRNDNISKRTTSPSPRGAYRPRQPYHQAAHHHHHHRPTWHARQDLSQQQSRWDGRRDPPSRDKGRVSVVRGRGWQNDRRNDPPRWNGGHHSHPHCETQRETRRPRYGKEERDTGRAVRDQGYREGALMRNQGRPSGEDRGNKKRKERERANKWKC